MKKFICAVALVFSMVSPSWAFTFPKVDHCAYTDGPRGWFGNHASNCSSGFIGDSEVAYQFSLKNNAKINSIEGWVLPASYSLPIPPYTEITISSINLYIFKDTIISEHRGHIPDPRTSIFKQSFDVEYKIPNKPNWHGVKNMDLELAKGTYWAAFVDGGPGSPFVSGHQGKPLRLDVVMAPEPISTTLFLVGAVPFLARLRKRK